MKRARGWERETFRILKIQSSPAASIDKLPSPQLSSPQEHHQLIWVAMRGIGGKPLCPLQAHEIFTASRQIETINWNTGDNKNHHTKDTSENHCILALPDSFASNSKIGMNIRLDICLLLLNGPYRANQGDPWGAHARSLRWFSYSALLGISPPGLTIAICKYYLQLIWFPK